MKPIFATQTLQVPPKQFFMSLQDIRFWIHSAQTDAELARLQKVHSVQQAFDMLYEKDADPWGYLVPRYRYQRLKYAKMLGMIPAREYDSVLDVGCGIGVFARMVAPYAREVLGVELSATAVRRARELSSNHPNVRFEQGSLLDMQGTTENQHDIVILADVLYYLATLSDEDLKSVVALASSLVKPGGILLVANHFFFDLDPQSRMIRRIHQAFQWTPSLTLLQEQRHPFFLASVLQKSV